MRVRLAPGVPGNALTTVRFSPFTINSRYDTILSDRQLCLGGTHVIKYDVDRDMIWTNEPLPTHPNGLRFSTYDVEGNLLAVNDYYSVGGGFVINERTQGKSQMGAKDAVMPLPD